mmetsp:Transcript_52533/g.139906  ORF Transcript_52533/g.139906 Transcript_52533/m.139906 type:complete len:328 (+) Transcript_52533:671-1654(+)
MTVQDVVDPVAKSGSRHGQRFDILTSPQGRPHLGPNPSRTLKIRHWHLLLLQRSSMLQHTLTEAIDVSQHLPNTVPGWVLDGPVHETNVVHEPCQEVHGGHADLEDYLLAHVDVFIQTTGNGNDNPLQLHEALWCDIVKRTVELCRSLNKDRSQLHRLLPDGLALSAYGDLAVLPKRATTVLSTRKLHSHVHKFGLGEHSILVLISLREVREEACLRPFQELKHLAKFTRGNHPITVSVRSNKSLQHNIHPVRLIHSHPCRSLRLLCDAQGLRKTERADIRHATFQAPDLFANSLLRDLLFRQVRYCEKGVRALVQEIHQLVDGHGL